MPTCAPNFNAHQTIFALICEYKYMTVLKGKVVWAAASGGSGSVCACEHMRVCVCVKVCVYVYVLERERENVCVWKHFG